MNSKQRTALLKAWYDTTMQSYFPATDEAFRRNTGFANPVGQAFQESMATILEGLMVGTEAADFTAPLDRIVRVLAVQGLPAGVAIRFLAVLRSLLEKNTEFAASEKKRWLVQLDELAELSVEIWCECRETLSQLRINELRNRIQQLEAGSMPRERGGNA
jgi:hypothetical protein